MISLKKTSLSNKLLPAVLVGDSIRTQIQSEKKRQMQFHIGYWQVENGGQVYQNHLGNHRKGGPWQLSCNASLSSSSSSLALEV